MRHPNPVAPLGQQFPQFARQQRPPLPPIGQPRQEVGTEQQVQQIQQQVHELALEIYARLAVEHLRGDVDPEYLDVLAGRSQTAARVYFESMGIQFDSRAAGS